MNKKVKLIKKYLEKKNEEEIINLIVEDYENNNLYVGLVYSNRINQYKVMFVDLDLVDNDVEEYVCYQFVRSSMVNFLIEYLENNVSIFQDDMFRFKYKHENYKVNMSIFLEREYLFLCNRYLPREWEFLYDILVLLFEHSPNIISEVCSEMLSLINNMDIIEYNFSYKFNLFKDKMNSLFSSKDISRGNKLEVKFLEYINNRYYSIIDDSLIIVEYNSRFKILNVYSEDEDMSKIYKVLSDIILEKFKCFYKIYLKDENVHYLCCNVEKNYLKVIDGVSFKTIPCSLYNSGNLSIEYDRDGYLEECLN